MNRRREEGGDSLWRQDSGRGHQGDYGGGERENRPAQVEVAQAQLGFDLFEALAGFLGAGVVVGGGGVGGWGAVWLGRVLWRHKGYFLLAFHDSICPRRDTTGTQPPASTGEPTLIVTL